MNNEDKLADAAYTNARATVDAAENEHQYGYYCWQSNQRKHPCHNSITAASAYEAAILAGASGWVLGHHDGQAHYSCPECAAALMGIYGPIGTLESYEDIEREAGQ